MKIIRLSAENYRRLKAVEITPDGTVQVITGRNAQGKTSVLEAIWAAIGGGDASRDTPRPVRDGEDHAEVTLDLGDLLVTRTWDVEKKKTELRVTAPDGAKYSTPQTLLDGLVGKLSFDPLAFTRLSSREQREALLDLLGLDFTAQDRERKRLFDERTDVGRQAHAFGELPKLAKDAPMTEVPAASVLDRIRASVDASRALERAHDLADECGRQIEHIDRRIAEAEAAITRLRGERGELEGRQASAIESLGTLPTPEDRTSLDDELASIEERNKIARDNQRIAAGRAQQKALEEKYAAIGQQIKAIDDSKARALAAATMPVDGLGFDEQGVTFNGVPFQQASSAEQIRVSLAMAMALNPTLRVIRILDGSLLDAESMAAITSMVAENDYQCWIERVEDDSAAAILIEDGSVVQR